MSKRFWNVKIGDIPKWAKANVSLSSTVRLPATAASSYFKYYNGSVRPMVHVVIFAIVVNYLYGYKELKKEAMRKYH